MKEVVWKACGRRWIRSKWKERKTKEGRRERGRDEKRTEWLGVNGSRNEARRQERCDDEVREMAGGQRGITKGRRGVGNNKHGIKRVGDE